MITFRTVLNIFILFFVAVSANPVEKRVVPNGAVEISDVMVPWLLSKSDPVQVPYPILINAPVPKNEVDMQLLQSLRAANQADMPVATKGILQNFYNIFQAALQEITRRQNALLGVINCTNCSNTGSPWLNFLNAMATIPSLAWVTAPNYQHTSNNGVKPGNTFIAATNQNGVVSGVGGSIVNGEPQLEYTFNNDGITHVKPNRPNKRPTNPQSRPKTKTFWSYQEQSKLPQ